MINSKLSYLTLLYGLIFIKKAESFDSALIQFFSGLTLFLLNIFQFKLLTLWFNFMRFPIEYKLMKFVVHHRDRLFGKKNLIY